MTILLIGGLFAVILLVYLLEIYGHLLRRRSKGDVMSDCKHEFIWTGMDSDCKCKHCGRYADATLCEELQSEVERLRSKMTEIGDWLILEYPTDSRTYHKGMELKAKAEGGEG